MSDEDLKSKYGRRNSSQQSQSFNNSTFNAPKKEDKEKYESNTTFTKKTTTKLTQQEKDIKANIEGVISKYSKDLNEQKEHNVTPIINSNNKDNESIFKKIFKGILIICIFLTIACIVIAIIAKPQIDSEGDQIIEQIKKSEDLYYAQVYGYCYFSKTNYNQTLGIDLSSCKYFTSCEVTPNKESSNYEIKLYGATNAFSMAYYYLKSLL